MGPKTHHFEQKESIQPYAVQSPEQELRFNFDIDTPPAKMWALLLGSLGDFELGSPAESSIDDVDDYIFLYLALSKNHPERYIRVGIGYCGFARNDASEDLFVNAEVQTVSLI
jgi:hypothetical protein